MNLQPVYPGRPEVVLPCAGHNGEMVALSGTAFADLEAAPGTYYCIRCVKLMMTYNAIGKALENRDRREYGLQQTA